MNLNGLFNIGSSGLVAGQAAMNIAGQNMANATTPGYRRQRLAMLPLSGAAMVGVGSPGAGVMVGGLNRALDLALLARLRHARGDEAGLLTDQRFLSGVESSNAMLGDQDLASRVETFLASFGDVAQQPGDTGVRTVVVQQGAALASQLRQLRSAYVSQRTELDRSLDDAMRQANDLLARVAQLTDSIRSAEAGGGPAPSLRDQRDAAVDELASLLDVTAVERPGGSIDLLVGSVPIMLDGRSRGLQVVQQQGAPGVVVAEDGAPIAPGGSVGGLLRTRQESVATAINSIDTMTLQLINAVNRIHVAGRGMHGRSEATAFIQVTDPAQPIGAEILPAQVQNGVLRIEIGDAGSENPTIVEVPVNPAVDSLQDIATRITNAGAGFGLTSYVDADNRMHLVADAGKELSVHEDTSGLFTAIQLGGFFTGWSASDVDVAEELVADPQLLSSGLDDDQSTVAAALAALGQTTLAPLGDTLGGYLRTVSGSLAARVRAATDAADAATLVREGLEAQEQQVSGVSVDDEAMRLLAAQQQFEASARFVASLQSAMQTLLDMAAR